VYGLEVDDNLFGPAPPHWRRCGSPSRHGAYGHRLDRRRGLLLFVAAKSNQKSTCQLAGLTDWRIAGRALVLERLAG